MKVIESKDLTKTYGKVTAVDNLTFSIEENSITGLIGPNGAGKTTLMKIIAGFLKSTSGEVNVYSQNPFNNLKVSSNMFFVGENMPLPQYLNVSELLESAGSFYPNWNDKLARRLFDYFSINPSQRFMNLSKGKKSTFNMIMGIAARCPLTLFDEPTSGMDAAVRKDFYRALLNDYLQHPRTIVFSSHLLNEVEHLLEDILLIKQGSKCLHLPVDEVKEYAIVLRGKAEMIDKFTADKEIIRRERFGKDGISVVLKNEFSRDELARLGVEVAPVSTNDLCVYLTSQHKGGIDDAFDRD